MIHLKTHASSGEEYSVDSSNWRENGFMVLTGFFNQPQIDSVNRLVDKIWDSRVLSKSRITVDAYLESSQYKRMLISSAPNEARLYPYKINDLFMEYEEIRRIVLDKNLRSVLAGLFDGEPIACNALNFEYGSQQGAHVDTLYMPPRKQNKLLVSWIALDTVDANNGPVRYYPGSHKIPAYRFRNGRINAVASEMLEFDAYMKNQLAIRGISSQEFTAQPGDVLIWHAQLFHGGTPILDESRRRRSLVTHYFRKQDYLHHFWRIRKSESGGFYFRRKHPPVA